jgi:hypothetical protein
MNTRKIISGIARIYCIVSGVIVLYLILFIVLMSTDTSTISDDGKTEYFCSFRYIDKRPYVPKNGSMTLVAGRETIFNKVFLPIEHLFGLQRKLFEDENVGIWVEKGIIRFSPVDGTSEYVPLEQK